MMEKYRKVTSNPQIVNSGKSSLFSTFSAASCVLLPVVSVALIDFVYFGDGTAEDQCVSRAFRLGVH